MFKLIIFHKGIQPGSVEQQIVAAYYYIFLSYFILSQLPPLFVFQTLPIISVSARFISFLER